MFLDIETAVRNRDGVFGDKKQPSEIGTAVWIYNVSCFSCSTKRSIRCSSFGISIPCGQCGLHWLQLVQ